MWDMVPPHCLPSPGTAIGKKNLVFILPVVFTPVNKKYLFRPNLYSEGSFLSARSPSLLERSPTVPKGKASHQLMKPSSQDFMG